MSRLVEVDPERIGRWVLGFAERHGGLAVSGPGEDAGLRLGAADGAVAVLHPLAAHGTVELGPVDLDVGRLAELLADWALPPDPLGLLLLRRGGYAVGVARGPRLVAHKSGSSYVQSRTAAGGWSQQRFARRRANQADALVGRVADHAARVVLPGDPAVVVVGGDRRLVADVLADPRLRPLLALPRRELYDLPDPRLAVLQSAVRRGRAVRVQLTDP